MPINNSNMHIGVVSPPDGFFLDDGFGVIVPTKNINLISDPTIEHPMFWTGAETDASVDASIINGAHIRSAGPTATLTPSEWGWNNTTPILGGIFSLWYELIYDHYESFCPFPENDCFTIQLLVSAVGASAEVSINHIETGPTINTQTYTITNGRPQWITMFACGTIDIQQNFSRKSLNAVGLATGSTPQAASFFVDSNDEFLVHFAQVHYGHKRETPIWGNLRSPLGAPNDAYGFIGGRNVSASFRNESAWNGGEYHDLSDYGFMLSGFEGLGYPDLDFNKTAYGQYGSLFNCATLESRTVTLDGFLYGCDPETFLQTRCQFGGKLFGTEPRSFYYRPASNDCDDIDECEVHFTAIVASGLSDEFTGPYGQEYSIDLEMCDVHFSDPMPQIIPATTRIYGVGTGHLDGLTANGLKVATPPLDFMNFSPPAFTRFEVEKLRQCGEGIIYHVRFYNGNVASDPFLFYQTPNFVLNNFGIFNEVVNDATCIGDTIYLSTNNGLFIINSTNGSALLSNLTGTVRSTVQIRGTSKILAGGNFANIGAFDLAVYDTATNTIEKLEFDFDYGRDQITQSAGFWTSTGSVHKVYQSPTDGRYYVGGDFRVFDAGGTPQNYRAQLVSFTLNSECQPESVRQHAYVTDQATAGIPPSGAISEIVECRGQIFVFGDMTGDPLPGLSTTANSNYAYVLIDRNSVLDTVAAGNTINGDMYGFMEGLSNNIREVTGVAGATNISVYPSQPVNYACCFQDRLYITAFHMTEFTAPATTVANHLSATLYEYTWETEPDTGTWNPITPSTVIEANITATNAEQSGLACSSNGYGDFSVLWASYLYPTNIQLDDIPYQAAKINNCRDADILVDMFLRLRQDNSSVGSPVFNDFVTIDTLGINNVEASLPTRLSWNGTSIVRWSELNTPKQIGGDTGIAPNLQGNVKGKSCLTYFVTPHTVGGSDPDLLTMYLVAYDRSFSALELVKKESCEFNATGEIPV